MKQKLTTEYLVKVGIFAAIAFVMMLFEFPVAALFPPYLKIDLSDIIALIGGITLGPVAVVYIQLIKNILNTIFHSTTFGIGEIANFLVGTALIVPMSFGFRGLFIKANENTHKMANLVSNVIIGSIAGILAMVVVALTANHFFLLPLYLGEGWTKLTLNAQLTTLLTVFAPFNAFKGVIVAIIGFIVHLGLQRIYPLIRLKNR